MAELIIYAGRFDPEFLNRAHDSHDSSGASQPAAGPAVQAGLKRAAAQAKMDYRKTCMLHRRLELGQVDEHNLEWWQRENLRTLADGSLLRRTNNAVAAFGHGTLHQGDDTMQIGDFDWRRHPLPPRRIRRARRGHLLGRPLRGRLGTAVLLSLR